MKNGRKVVFVQTEDPKAVGSFLGSLEQNSYLFVILPSKTKFLTKEELKKLLKGALGK